MKRLILLAVFATSYISSAQGWIPWQNTPQGTSITSNKSVAALTEGSLLTVAYNVKNKIEIQQYNGLNWTPLPSPKRFGIFATDSVRELIRYKGNLYMISQQVFWKFDGQVWTDVQTASSGSYEDIEIYNNLLVFGGFHNTVATTNLYTYDGSLIGSLPAMPVFLEYITGIHVKGNDLYISAYDNNLLGTGQKGLVKFDGANWTDAATFIPASSNYSGKGLNVFEMKNKLYIIDINGVSEVRNDSIIEVGAFASPMSPFSLQHAYPEVEVLNDTAYLGWRYKSASQLITDIKIFTGNSTVSLTNSPSTITDFEVYQNTLLAFGPGVTSSSNTLSSMIWSKSTNSGSLTVDLFWDQNTNCQKDVGDTNVLNQFISLNNGQIFFATVTNQVFNLPAGTYTIDTVYTFNKFGRHVTPACTWPTSFTIVAQQQTDVKLPLALNAVDDLSVDIVGTRGWRSLFGFKEGYIAIVRNLGGNTQSNVNLTVEYDQKLTFHGTKPPASSTGLGTASWTIPQIKPLQQMAFFVELSTNSSFILGDSLTFIASVTGQTDVYPRDNKDTTVQSVVGAFDPNDKEASETKIRPGTKRIDYHIRFQNTGSDTAHKVTVVDSLDWSIPVTKIIINSASHPYKFSVKGKVLIWEFDNIMLPDSGADYAGSQGYVRFSAGLNPSLYVGDTIFNDAQIYFDYQTPVHTKKAKTAVVAWISIPENANESISLDIFPNPAKDELHILNNENEALEFQLINSAGVVVDEVRAEPEARTTIRVNELSPGLYLLNSKSSTYKIIIK